MEFFKYGRLPTPSNSSSYTTVLNTQDLEKKKNQTTIHTHTCTHPSYGHILLRVLNRNQKPEAFSLRQNNCTGWISSSVLILLAWWPSQCGGYNLETQSHWPEEAGTEFSTTATELRGWSGEPSSLYTNPVQVFGGPQTTYAVSLPTTPESVLQLLCPAKSSTS